MMKLSIIVPTYNCRDYIEECIDSILDQLNDDDELIVVDDGSNDGTDRIIEEYEKDPRVKIIFRRHEGASGARNAGLDAADGEYIAFVDCDDYLRKGFLSEGRELLLRNPDMVIFGFERIFLDGRRQILSVRNRMFTDVSSFADEYIRTREMLIYSACNKFYRKKIIDRFNIRFDTDVEFGEDRLFNYSFIKKAGLIFTSETIMFNYMQRSLDSMSSKHYSGFFGTLLRLHEEKMKCFLILSKGTSREERERFVNLDFRRTVVATVERFTEHPEEKEENLQAVAQIIYGRKCSREEEDRIVKVDIPSQELWYYNPCDNAVLSGLI